jgi:hypothetical protein
VSRGERLGSPGMVRLTDEYHLRSKTSPMSLVFQGKKQRTKPARLAFDSYNCVSQPCPLA